MKPDNWNRFAAGLLAILLCLCSFSMPAFASGSDPAPEPLPEIIEEEPTTGGMEPEGMPITPKGNATLVDDFYGDKQLITVTTKAGNYFYILIDRANEDKETSVHFLNQVDDADLLALLDEEPQETEVCTCTVKCEAGNVNENCPLCEKSLHNCTAPEAVKTDTETPQEKPKSNMGSLMILLALALAGWVQAALPWLMSAAAGCMVCVTAQEMIPEAVEADEPAGVISVVLGFALMMALDVAL